MKILVIINQVYPFGNGETFLETETNFYTGFDKVLLFPCSVYDDLEARKTNGRVDVVEYPRRGRFRRLGKALWYLRAFFTRDSARELAQLARRRKLSFGTMKSLLFYVSHGTAHYRFIRKYLKKNFGPGDTLVFYSYWMHFHAYAAVKLKQYFGPGAVCVSRCHGFDLYEYRSAENYLPLRRYVLENLDTVFCISEDGGRYIEARYPAFRKHLVLSRLGTLDHGVKNTAFSGGIFTVVSCSACCPVKRVDRIIDALALLAGRNIRWVHLGGGPLFEQTKAYAEKKLRGKISFEFKGQLRNEEIMDYYAKEEIHLFINASESEGIPVSVMEAASFGIPAVAPDVGGTSEIIRDGVNGFLLKKDFSSRDFADRIVFVSGLPDGDYQALRQNARRIWQEKYSAEANYRKFCGELARL